MSQRLRLVLAAAFGAVCASGCVPGKKPEATTASGSGNLDPILGPVHAGRKAAQRMVTAHELRNIHIFINSALDMPSKEQIIAALKQEDPKAYQLIQEGAIVLTGAKSRESIWAYEKDAPTQGGWVVLASGPDRLTAEQVQQLLKQSN